jgi:hypothetical protein
LLREYPPNKVFTGRQQRCSITRVVFARKLFEEYLAHFELYPFDDEFYVVSSETPAILFQQISQVWRAEEYSLAEVKSGKPWKRQ